MLPEIRLQAEAHAERTYALDQTERALACIRRGDAANAFTCARESYRAGRLLRKILNTYRRFEES